MYTRSESSSGELLREETIEEAQERYRQYFDDCAAAMQSNATDDDFTLTNPDAEDVDPMARFELDYVKKTPKQRKVEDRQDRMRYMQLLQNHRMKQFNKSSSFNSRHSGRRMQRGRRR